MKLLAWTLAALVVFARAALAEEPGHEKQVNEIRAIALRVSMEYREQLIRELKLSGPLRSLVMCKFLCPEIVSSKARKLGWKISMVSLRPRDPAVGTADAWEQKVLFNFSRRAAKGAGEEVLEYAQVVKEPQGRYLRYGRALTAEPLCLTCHGARKALPEEVKTQLAIDYPFDEATGYRAGEVIGMVSIKRPLQ